eukprot:768822-Hanusia_phi.AAC.4
MWTERVCRPHSRKQDGRSQSSRRVCLFPRSLPPRSSLTSFAERVGQRARGGEGGAGRAETSGRSAERARDGGREEGGQLKTSCLAVGSAAERGGWRTTDCAGPEGQGEGAPFRAGPCEEKSKN